MKRKLKNARPQAWLGAVIGAVAGIGSSVLGAGMSSHQQKEAMKRQAALEQQKQNQQAALNLTNELQNSQQLQNDYEEQFKQPIARNGMRRKLRNADVKIEKGGGAIALGDNTFLLRGNSHNAGGIDMDINGTKIEAEGGEVYDKKPNEVRIFSDTLKLPNGMTPAQAVMAGGNKDAIFNYQERSKRKLSCGGHIRPKAELGLDVTTGDWIGLGTDILGSLGISYFGGRRLANSLSAPRRPVLTSAAKLKTTYNIAPRVANLRRSNDLTNDAVYRETPSSVTALSRVGKNNTVNTNAINELYGEKENRENKLINQDLLNRQSVAIQNAQTINSYYDKLTDFENRRAELRNKSITGSLTGLSQAATNLLENASQRYENNRSLAAMLEASQTGTAERLATSGLLPKQTVRMLRDAAYARSDNDAYDLYNSLLKRRTRRNGSIVIPSTINVKPYDSKGYYDYNNYGSNLGVYMG